MQASKTKTRPASRGRVKRSAASRRRTPDSTRPRQARHAGPESFIVTAGERTHVLLEVAEYERLRAADERDELRRRLEAPRKHWVHERDAALVVAAGEIAAARQRAGLTQQELGERLGVPQSQISRIERNPDRSTVRTLKRIAAALDVDVSDFLRSGPTQR